MNYHLFPILAALAIFSTTVSADDSDDTDSSKQISAFSKAEIFLEQNYSDGDTEVVILAKSGDVGLKKFRLIAPDGKTVYRFSAPKNGRNIGGREILVESPEPPDLNKVLSAYPAGTYTFVGKSFSGEWLVSTKTLSHDIPTPTTISYPQQDSMVSRHNLNITWEPVPGAVAYVLELENEETELKLEIDIAGNENQFLAPADWVAAGAEYQVGVFAINEAGNKTTSELTFFTLAE